MLTGEASEVLDEGPDLPIRQLISISNEAGTGRSVFNQPEDFAFRTLAPESLVMEISR